MQSCPCESLKRNGSTSRSTGGNNHPGFFVLNATAVRSK
jgi:hypothetical protein